MKGQALVMHAGPGRHVRDVGTGYGYGWGLFREEGCGQAAANQAYTLVGEVLTPAPVLKSDTDHEPVQWGQLSGSYARQGSTPPSADALDMVEPRAAIWEGKNCVRVQPTTQLRWWAGRPWRLERINLPTN